jgi:hypothetical protein
VAPGPEPPVDNMPGVQSRMLGHAAGARA